MGGPRTDLAWPRVIEAELHAAGRPATVRCEAYPAELTITALRSWDEEVIPWSPDVVILQLGQVETIHRFLPRLVRDHLHTFKTRPGPIRSRYRVAASGLWMLLLKVQRAVDARIEPTRFFGRRRRRVVADLQHLIVQVRKIASPLVIVPDFLDPEPTYERWFPGNRDRLRSMNAAIDEMVAGFDHPDIRRFSVREVVASMGLETSPSPDGAHYSPEVHRAVGRALAGVILEWAADQPHLKLP
jgi:hypothetical protein